MSGPLVVGPAGTAATVTGNGVDVVSGDLQLRSGKVVASQVVSSSINVASFAAVTAGTVQTQAGATAITTEIAQVTVGTASDGVILPALSAALIGARITLINASANAGKIYCPGATSTNTINGTAGATGVALAASKTTFLVAVSATAWVSTLSN